MLQKYCGGKCEDVTKILWGKEVLRTATVMPFSPAMRRESNEREEAEGAAAAAAAAAAAEGIGRGSAAGGAAGMNLRTCIVI